MLARSRRSSRSAGPDDRPPRNCIATPFHSVCIVVLSSGPRAARPFTECATWRHCRSSTHPHETWIAGQTSSHASFKPARSRVARVCRSVLSVASIHGSYDPAPLYMFIRILVTACINRSHAFQLLHPTESAHRSQVCCASVAIEKNIASFNKRSITIR